MPEPLEVTDADVRAAWDVLYTVETGPYTYKAVEPKDDHFTKVFLDGIRRALENDRKRVLERENA